MQKTQQFMQKITKASKGMASLVEAVAPVARAGCGDYDWRDAGNGYIEGFWHEDGSPYLIKCPPQLVPAMIAAQKICSIVRSHYENRTGN